MCETKNKKTQEKENSLEFLPLTEEVYRILNQSESVSNPAGLGRLGAIVPDQSLPSQSCSLPLSRNRRRLEGVLLALLVENDLSNL